MDIQVSYEKNLTHLLLYDGWSGVRARKENAGSRKIAKANVLRESRERWYSMWRCVFPYVDVKLGIWYANFAKGSRKWRESWGVQSQGVALLGNTYF